MAKNLRLIEVNTTAYQEENFLLLTNLSDEEIVTAIKPLVEKERIGEEFYDNEDLAYALNKSYPDATILFYTPDGVETLNI
jgi:hypothetical protein